MKLQGFTIIFALVAIPLILVLAYYIQLQVNTITLQNEYDTKLLDATYDAMSSFEINTANEDLSSVSDSLRTIIEASNNTFFTTLATNLGISNASKSSLESYIPALLYTLYDGYYISSPTQVPTVLVDPSTENAVSVGDKGVKVSGNYYTYDASASDEASNYLSYGDLNINSKTDYGQLLYLAKNATDTNKIYTTDINDAQMTTDNVLKSYIPYSARYKRDDAFDITVVYTLDNYVTIEGTIKEGTGTSIADVYYTKSGYLLSKDSIGNIEVEAYNDDGTAINLVKNYNQNDAEDFIKAGNQVIITIYLTDDGTRIIDETTR